MSESWRTRLWRYGFNLFPAYRRTGARVTYIRGDFREIRVKLPLNLRTRNYVGTIFGGSMYAAVDPLFMMMLVRSLGEDFTVWDREGHITYEQPGESTLYATCEIDDAELHELRGLDAGESTVRSYETDLVDDDGEVHATVEKQVYVRRE